MNDLSKNLILAAVFIGLALAAADWILGRIVLQPSFFEAMRQGADWDRRSRLDVLLDERESDPNWFPGIPGNTFLEARLDLDGKHVLPLGGVANTNAVGCNENGFYSVLKTDEAGFRNPVGTWPLSANRYNYLVGDSFTAGACVRDGDHIADRLRKDFPPVINLGVGGNGPLFELAGIVEYVIPGKVSNVFWLYYEGNDLNDLVRDKNSPLLMQYLDPEFSQNLLENQGAINAAVRAYAETRIQEKIEGRAIIFRNLRELIWKFKSRETIVQQHKGTTDDSAHLRLFGSILKRAKIETEKKGGKLVFIYLPEYFRFSTEPIRYWSQYNDEVKELVRSLDIPIIDIEQEFANHPDPLDLFPFRLHGHYAPDGYALVSDAIVNYIADHQRSAQ